MTNQVGVVFALNPSSRWTDRGGTCETSIVETGYEYEQGQRDGTVPQPPVVAWRPDCAFSNKQVTYSVTLGTFVQLYLSQNLEDNDRDKVCTVLGWQSLLCAFPRTELCLITIQYLLSPPKIQVRVGQAICQGCAG